MMRRRKSAGERRPTAQALILGLLTCTINRITAGKASADRLHARKPRAMAK